MIDTLKENEDKGVKITYPNNKIYDPTEKYNIGYFINNSVSEFINTSYFANHEIKVKLYDNNH